MTHYILVKVDTPATTKSQALVNEILSNLESVVNEPETEISGNILVVSVPGFDQDLLTLYRSTQDQTSAMECAAALANFSGDLLEVLDVLLPDVPYGETDLSGFTTTVGKRERLAVRQ